MRPTHVTFGTLGALALAAGLWLLPVAAQAPAGIATPWTMPRTPEGTPDLQGNWTNATVTPLERPPGQPAALSPDVVAKIEKGVKDRIERLAAPSDPNRPAPPQGGDGFDRRRRQRRRLQQLLDRRR